MGRIALAEGFQRIPEGTYIFRCCKVEHDENYGEVKVHLVTANGDRHIETYRLLDSNGEINNGAQFAFSVTARALMCQPDISSVDTADLVDKYMKATVTHEKVQSRKNPSEMVTYVKLTDKVSATGYDSKPFDLNSLLGGKNGRQA